MGLVLRRRNGTEKNTLLLLLPFRTEEVVQELALDNDSDLEPEDNDFLPEGDDFVLSDEAVLDEPIGCCCFVGKCLYTKFSTF